MYSLQSLLLKEKGDRFSGGLGVKTQELIMIYLDNAATTEMSAAAKEAYIKTPFGVLLLFLASSALK